LPQACELLGRAIRQAAVRPCRVIVQAPQCDLSAGVTQIAEPVHIEALVAKSSMEAFHVPVGLRRQLHRNATVRVKLFGSLTRSTRGTAASSSWLRIRTHGVKIGSSSTTNINN
jgi:hypothetical protein